MPHVTRAELEQISDPTSAPQWVADHLRACAKCRRQAALYRLLADARTELMAARPGRATRTAVLRGRPHAPRRLSHGMGRLAPGTWRKVAGVAALLMIAVPVALWRGVPEAAAARGELHFLPATPARGDRVLVEYRPAGTVREPVLLRARLRVDGDNRAYSDIGTVTLTELRATGDGRWGGEFVIPDSVSYAALAVEAANGSDVDTNFGRLWELVVHEAGVPAPAALMQKVEDHLIRNWQVALETSRELTRLHPYYVPGWRARYNRERAITAEPARESLKASYHRRVAELSAHWAPSPQVDAITAFELAFLAEIVGSTDVMDMWKTRLYREHPTHPLTQEFLTVDVVHTHGTDAPRMLSVLDSLWRAAPAGHQSLAWEGVQAAQRAGDGTAAALWAARYAGLPVHRARYGTYPAGLTRYVASMLAATSHAAAHQRAADWMTEELDHLERVLPRIAGETLQEWRFRLEDARRARLVVLAAAQRALGKGTASVATLQEAAELGWNVGVFRDLVAQLGIGSQAAPYAARWVVDPETPTSVADSIAGNFVAHVARAEWDALIELARADMRRKVERQLIGRPLRADPAVVASNGQRRRLQDLLGSQVTLVAYWSRWCEPSLQQLDELKRVAARFEYRGYSVITIADEPPSPGLAGFIAQKRLDVPVYHDSHREAAPALGQWGTPHYFLIDADGVVRYESRTPGSLLRVADVLIQQRHTPASQDQEASEAASLEGLAARRLQGRPGAP